MKCTVSINKMDEIQQFSQLGITGIVVGILGFHSGCDGVFTLEEIKICKTLCDKHALECTVMMNRLYFDEEMQEVKEIVKEVLALGCRILYCDPAIYLAAEALGKQNQLVYDASTLMCNSRDAQVMLDLGLDSVVLSREITLEEICRIANKVTGNTIVQTYGYQVMAHSKRHFLKNYLKEIKKEMDLENRRDLTLIETTRTGKMPILEEKEGCRIYTDYVLCALNVVKEMERAGVHEVLLDGLFIDRIAYTEAITAFVKAIHHEDCQELSQKLREKNPVYSDGYMYTKTNLLKGEGN